MQEFYGNASGLDIAGRILIAGFFLVMGLLNMNKAGIDDHINRLRGSGTPMPAQAFWFGIFLQFAGVAMILLNYRPDVGCVFLIVFTVFASLFLLRFWDVKDNPMRRTIMRNGMMANVAIIGGLLLLLQNVR
jgi:uncharacterized membrane protein YphA (DoxX/SURF4 family)